MDIHNAVEVTGTPKTYHRLPFIERCCSPPSLLQLEGRGLNPPLEAPSLLPLHSPISPPAPLHPAVL